MRRRSELHTFDERLNAEKARIEAALESADPGPKRDLLETQASPDRNRPSYRRMGIIEGAAAA